MTLQNEFKSSPKPAGLILLNDPTSKEPSTKKVLASLNLRRETVMFFCISRCHSLKRCFTRTLLRPLLPGTAFSFLKHPHPPFISRPLTSHRNVASHRSGWDSAVMKCNHLEQEERFCISFTCSLAPPPFFLSNAFLLEFLHDFTSADEHVDIHMFLITDDFNASSLHASVSPLPQRTGAQAGWADCCATELTI